MERLIDIEATDGVIDAHIFTPAATKGLPPVILFTDIAGLRSAYRTKAQKIADAGYAVLMPNIYYRTVRGEVMSQLGNVSDPMAALFQHAEMLTPDALARDFAALLSAVEREPEFRPGSIGAIGYCLTGGFPVRLASLFPERIGAAVGFHSAQLASGPRSIIDVIPAVRAQVYFGHADKDPYLDADQIARVDEALARAGVHFITELFAGAAHGFTTEDSAAYDAKADALHYKRIFSLLEEAVPTP